MKYLFDKISTHLLSILAAALTPILAAIAIFFRDDITAQIKELEPQILAILLVSLALGCVALFAWVLSLLPFFKYIPKYQFYQHRFNGLYYCPTCRNKEPLSPLRYEKTGWRCPFKECHKFYKDPDYIEQQPVPEKPKSIYRS